MADTLSRLIGPAAVALGTSTVKTVAADHKLTIKNITIVNNTSAEITIRLGIGGVADANLVTQDLTIGAKTMFPFDCFIVMEAAETLQANTSAAGLTIYANGLDQDVA